MKNLQDLRIFIETARQGSLSACARQMNLSPAVTSAAIKRLETELQAVLFIRSTRRLRLTQQGKTFLQHCQEAITLLDEAQANLHLTQSTLRGVIQLSAPSDLGRNHILPWLDTLMEKHPELAIHLHLSDSPADLYSQPVDLALRYATPKDSALIAMCKIFPNVPTYS